MKTLRIICRIRYLLSTCRKLLQGVYLIEALPASAEEIEALDKKATHRRSVEKMRLAVIGIINKKYDEEQLVRYWERR